MTDEGKPEQHKPSARGEAAWKEQRERIAERNAAARKAGRAERDAYERKQDASRRARELDRQAKLTN
ncbi:MAG: hypothetical protein ACREX8_12220 [Gammaproteobacteria bacterium]